MPFTLEPLPYALDHLEPFISRETLEFHYGKHHQGYVNKLNTLVKEDVSLTSLLKEGTQQGIYNNAAQIWNHSFYWKCMINKPTPIPKNLETLLIENFGSVQEFESKFSACAAGHFGSGWVWLVQTADSKLQIIDTHDAVCPLTKGLNPLLVLDVWEHAYYIDKRNNRLAYITDFFKLINWEFVAGNLGKSSHL